MRYFLILALLLTLILGCIDPIKFKYKGQQASTLIQGIFDNIPSYKTINVSISTPFGDPYVYYVPNAKVSITSLEGENYNFKFVSSGTYQSVDSISAIPGHTYTVNVEFDGKKYGSVPEKCLANGVEITSISMRDSQGFFKFSTSNKQELTKGLEFLVNFTDTPNTANFYRWSYKNIYQVLTQPYDYIDYSCRGCPRPAPKSCCKDCWISENVNLVNPLNDWLKDGKEINNHKLMFIPYNQFLNIKMVLNLYQHSISEQAYNYYNALQNQMQSDGSMFDAPPSELKGNIKCISDPTEKALGFFEISNARVHKVVIHGDSLNKRISPFVYPDDCRVLNGATTVRPINW